MSPLVILDLLLLLLLLLRLREEIDASHPTSHDEYNDDSYATLWTLPGTEV